MKGEVGFLIEKLSMRRRLLGLNQQQVADRMGTTQSAVSELETGHSDPRMSTLVRYAQAVDAELQIALHTSLPPDYYSIHRGDQ